MKKTYFYKNHKIRTSEHDYKYALIVENGDEIRVAKCSASYKGCETELNHLTKLYNRCQAKGIDFEEAAAYFWARVRGEPKTSKQLEAIISGIWSNQVYKPSTFKIVEVEAR